MCTHGVDLGKVTENLVAANQILRMVLGLAVISESWPSMSYT